jgi:hypothetical protein
MLINDASITGSLIVNASSSFQNIAVSGNILPGTNNVYNLGSVDKYFKEIFVSTSSINFVDGNGIVTASLSANVLNSLIQNTGSANSSISSINTFTGSFSASVSSSITTISSSVTTTITTLSSSVSTSFSSSAASVTSLSSSVSESVTSLSSSLTSVNTTQNNRLSSIESATGSYSKLSGGNTFTGVQIISGSTFIAGDLIVQGSSSIQYISASSVSIGTNTINLNTNTPAVRFAGISIFDSGSNAQTASIFWDGFCNKFIYSNPSSVGYSGGMLISGPRNTGSMGEENGLTCNVLATSIGSDHISSSAIFHDPTTTCFYNSTTINSSGILTSTNLVGTICARNGVVSGSSQITGITNAQLSNSTISGISLGSNLATLTIGTGLSGTSYNGSSAVTIANTGVTSNVAGTGVSVSGATGAVTISIGQAVATSSSPTFAGLTINGAITATGDITAFYSDGRLKENLKIISNPIEKIRKITGYTYNTNQLGKVLLNNENDNDNKVGLIAQDLEKVLPEAVKLAPFDRDENGNSKSGENYLTIQYEKVVPLLVEAIKEQQIKIDNLTIEVENLKKSKGL